MGPPAPCAAVSVGKPCRLTAARKALVRGRPPIFPLGWYLLPPTATHAYQLASRVSTEVTPSRTLGPLHSKEAVERLPPPHPMHHLGEASRG